MSNKYLVYCILVTFFCSLASWSGLARRAAGGQGSSNSWHSWSSGGGVGGGGHK